MQEWYLLCPDLFVEKVAVRGRGAALGYAVARPIEEIKPVTKKQMEARLVHYLSGRASEEVVLGDVSGGAVADIKKANDLARDMVVNYGMGEMTGFSQPLNANGAFELTEAAKTDVQTILKSAYDRALDIIKSNKDWVKSKTESLMSLGVLTHEQLFSDVTRQEINFVSDKEWVKDVLDIHAEKIKRVSDSIPVADDEDLKK